MLYIHERKSPVFCPHFFNAAIFPTVFQRLLQIARQDSQTDSDRQLFATDVQLTTAEGVTGWKAPPQAHERFPEIRIGLRRRQQNSSLDDNQISLVSPPRFPHTHLQLMADRFVHFTIPASIQKT
jgi:hypothetical protein